MYVPKYVGKPGNCPPFSAHKYFFSLPNDVLDFLNNPISSFQDLASKGSDFLPKKQSNCV